MNYERPNIRRMAGYAAGEQPSKPDTIKLNTNENPYPASAAVAEALSEIRVEDLRRYPPPFANGFREVAAACHGVDIDNIIATNGGDELLRLVITTFADAGQPLAMAEPSYSLYPVLADIQGCPVSRIDLAGDWSMSADFLEQLNASGAVLVFIVNPHAPSGRLTPAEQIRSIASGFNGIVVLDEAYVDFVDPGLAYDAAGLVHEFDNVLILRTMSKGYSLAGLRFAYGIGSASLLAPMLYKTRDSYNTDYISQKLATAALRDRAQAALSWERVRAERLVMHRALTDLGFTCAPSQSNFILAQVPPDRSGNNAPDAETARNLYLQLKEAGILIRYFDQPRLRDKLRITIGTSEENGLLITQLKMLLAGTG